MKNFLTFSLFLLLSTANGIKITCEFNYISQVGFSSLYFCNVNSIDYSDNPTYFTSANGTHLNGQSNLNVKHIQFYRAKIGSTFPKGLLSVFPNLIGLNIAGSQIKELKGDELYEYPTLEIFSISDSNITRIPQNFFAQTPNIRNVGFNRAQTQFVADGVFDNLKNLTVFYFTGNKCLSKDALNAADSKVLVQQLIKDLCPDIAPKCEIYNNLEEFVCGLEDSVKNEIGGLTAKYYEMRTILIKLESLVTELVSRP
jgi:Leucine-rich repeat (LRR) protein